MKVNIIIAMILLSMNVSLCAQSIKCITETEYFALKEIYAEAITTNEYPELAKFHGELGDEDRNLNVLLTERQKDAFVVMLEQEEYIESEVKIKLYAMTLTDSIDIYVYSNMYNSLLVLYNSPCTQSVKEQCDTYVAEPLFIIDVHNTWLKVQFEESGKKYEGWIPKEEYCSNPYTTCN